MVKITDPNKKEEKLTLKKKKLIQKIYNEDPTTHQNKKMKIQLRLTPAVEQQLRQYAEVKGTTVTDAVEQIINKKFHEKKINRQYFNLKSQATILLPRSEELLKHYAKEHINMVAHITQTSNDQYTINFFDKQASLFSNHPEDLKVVTIQQVNNAFDIYDNSEECYFTEYNVDTVENKLLNHAGLIIITLGSTEDNDQKLNIRVPVFVHTYDGELQEATVITSDDAIKLAEKYNNPMLKEYLTNIDGVIQFEEVEDLLARIDILSKLTLDLEEENKKLQYEVQHQQVTVQSDEQMNEELEKLRKENIRLKSIVDHVDTYTRDIIDAKIRESIDHAMKQAKEEAIIQVLDTYPPDAFMEKKE